MPCGKGLLTTSPNSPAKAISHMVLFGEHFFFGSHLWVSRVEVFAALYGAFGKTALGQGMCLCCCLIHPFLD